MWGPNAVVNPKSKIENPKSKIETGALLLGRLRSIVSAAERGVRPPPDFRALLRAARRVIEGGYDEEGHSSNVARRRRGHGSHSRGRGGQGEGRKDGRRPEGSPLDWHHREKRQGCRHTHCPQGWKHHGKDRSLRC